VKQVTRLDRAKSLARARAQSKRSGELKVADISFQGYIREKDYENTSLIGLANPIGSGTARYQRVGRKIWLRSVRIRGIVEFRFTNRPERQHSQYGIVCRFALVYDTQPQGVLPLASDIFEQLDQEGETEFEITSSLNTNNTDRFRVLRDFFIVGNPPYLPAAEGEDYIPTVRTSHLIDEFVDLQELVTIYNNDNSDSLIPDIASGGLYFIRMASLDDSPNAAAWLDGCSLRLRYTDCHR